jgi:putative membrane protein
MHTVGGWWFMGMHVFWWLFWVLIIIAFASLFTPVPKQQAKRRDTPIDVLQRRSPTRPDTSRAAAASR